MSRSVLIRPQCEYHKQDVHLAQERLTSNSALGSFDNNIDRLAIPPPKDHNKPSKLQIDKHIAANEDPIRPVGLVACHDL